jgi:Cu+-exporting ATPase
MVTEVFMHSKLEWLRIVGAGMAIALVWFGVLNPTMSLTLSIAAVAFSGYPVFREAFNALWKRRMTMELSMSIAIIAALFVSESFTAQVIVFFVLLAEELEHATVHRGRNSISSLLDLLPRMATVKRGDEYVDIEAADVKPADTVLVRPGARIVVDGTVISGNSFVDEATITGESLPVEKVAGSPVFAGTVNQSGAIEVRADRVGADTAFGKIVHAVEQAEKTRADIQRLADRLAGYLVVFSLAAAALTFAITLNVRDTISVVIVAGACGIAAGTPLAILGSIGRAAKLGSIIKGGLYLERLAQIKTVVFDKTGTLTYGTPHVVSVLPAAGMTPYMVLEIAAAAENLSEHPLAKAIIDRASELGITPKRAEKFSYTPGRGIACEVDGQPVAVGNRALMVDSGVSGLPRDVARLEHVSEVHIASGGILIGRIHIADTVRPEAKQAIAELKRMGVRTVMLTGDAEPIARAVAQKLDMDEFAADLRPEQKRDRVRAMQSGGKMVAMIGDGVNDAPALTEATVGVAVGSATGVALESADVVLIGSDLLKFVETVRIARRCQRVIYFNFIGTIVVDMIGMGLAFAGMLNPMLAALVHVGSELAFLLNSARLLSLSSFKRK